MSASAVAVRTATPVMATISLVASAIAADPLASRDAGAMCSPTIPSFKSRAAGRPTAPLNLGAPSGGGSHAEHLAGQIDRVLGAELLHDVGAMNLHRPLTDPERPGGFLVGGAGGDLGEDLVLAAGQELAPREPRQVRRP